MNPRRLRSKDKSKRHKQSCRLCNPEKHAGNAAERRPIRERRIRILREEEMAAMDCPFGQEAPWP